MGFPEDVQLILLQQLPEGSAYRKLIKRFEEKGSADLNVAQNEQIDFTAEEWNSYDDVKKQQILMNYRIAYLGETW